MPAEIPLSIAVAILAMLVSAGTAVVLALRKDAASARDGEIDRRLDALELSFSKHVSEQYAQLDRRLHTDEIETEKVRGQLALVHAKQQGAEAIAAPLTELTRALRDVLRLPPRTPYPGVYRGGRGGDSEEPPKR
jgi:hypothetical protein